MTTGSHNRDAEPIVRHGTAGAYGWHRCRCDDCRAWKADASRRYRTGEVAYRRGPMLRPADPDDVDEVAVQRACNGDRTVTLNRAEQNAVIDQLTRRGHSAREIGQRLGIASRTVVRWRSRLAS